MKKFRFRLERVLSFRDGVKKEKQRELAQKQGTLREAETKVDEILELQDQGTGPKKETMSMADLKLQSEYQQSLQEALVQQRLLVLDAARAVEEARDIYLEKAVEAEMLESLKERRFKAHLEEAKRQERKASDEITVLRHRFRDMGKGESNE